MVAKKILKPEQNMKRKFYKTVLQVEILSETPVNFDNLADVAYAITEGDCCGTVKDILNNKEISAKKCAEQLFAFGSEPGFFQLDEDGNDLD